MKLKLIAFLLLLSMLIFSLGGCVSQNTTTAPEDPSDHTPKEPPQPGYATLEEVPPPSFPQDCIQLAYDEESEYCIVYPKAWREQVLPEAQRIEKQISDVTGCELELVMDSETPPKEQVIRLEKVPRIATDPALEENDFIVSVKDGVVSLSAVSLSGMTKAVTYFIEKLLYIDAENRYIGVKDEFELRHNDSDEHLTLYTGCDENYLYFTVNVGTPDEAITRISFTGNKAWRIQTKSRMYDEFKDIGASQRLSLSLMEMPVLPLEKITVTEEDGVVTAVAPDESYVILTTAPFSLKFYTPSGMLAQHISALTTTVSGAFIQGDILPNEGVFGTGERFNTVNQRGKNIHMYTKDIWAQNTACYIAVPLLCFTRGSGVFLNMYEEMNMHLGNVWNSNLDDVWTADVIGTVMDCYIYTSEQMSDAIYGYSTLSGFAELPEEWTYGMIICRYSPDLTQKWSSSIGQNSKGNYGRGMGVYDTIAKMEAYDLPWSGILAEAWDPYNESKQADLKELCDYVHSLGKKFLVYISVGCAVESQGGFSPNYLVSVTLPDGSTTTRLPYASDNPDTGGNGGTFPYLDITNPTAVQWFFDEYWDHLTNVIGVDGCKIDFCELMPEYYELNYYDEDQPTAGSHHWYPTAFCAMFWDMVSSKPDSGMNYTRGGGIGSQRSPYMWAGDQIRTYEGIGDQLIACLSSGLSGIPFMSYDMSGYQYGSGSGLGSGTNDQPYREGQVFVRGLQFTAFTICMQQHGKVRQAFEFADGVLQKEFVLTDPETNEYTWVNKTLKDSSGNVIYETDENGQKIPLRDSFGNIQKDEDGNILYQPKYEYLIKPGEMSYITDIYRGYVKLHELLTPYINEYSAIACDTGMPLMRALVLMWQDDTNVYNIDDEYMFGDAFLVAPILNSNYKRNIYLPEGEWKDLNTGTIHTVGKEGKWLTNYTAELQQLPVFYNVNHESETADELLSGIEDIFGYLNSIDCSAFYDHTGKRP